MDKRYRIIVSGKKMYKEIEVTPESKVIRFGTENNCDFRVRKDLFFEPIELTFTKDVQGQWNVMCSDNLYICIDEIRKLMTAPVQHGTELLFKYQKSSSDALHIQFLIDFDYEHKEYNRKYDISSLKAISIGSAPDNNIIIGGLYTSNDKVLLNNNKNSLELYVQSSTYGVYHNGNLVNKQAEIKNGDFFSIANFSFYYKNNCLLTQQSNDLKDNGVKYLDSTERLHYPKFNRNSRVKTLLDDTKIEILDPPAIPKKPKNNLITRLLPSIVMIIASIIVGFGGGLFILVSMASALAGIITAIIGVREAKKDYKKEFNDRITKYNAYIDKKRIELNEARLEELNVLQDKYISEQEEIARLKKFSYELFDRCKEDEDFLEVRLGVGKLESKRKVDYKKQERLEIEDDLQNYPKNLYEQYKYISEAPIVCNFKESSAVGIIGNEKSRFDLMKNIIVDICARQYHSDVELYFVAEEKHMNKVYWLRMLPQVYNNVLGIHNIVCDNSSRTIIFEYLYKELTFREQNKKLYPHIIVFLYDECGFKSHPISRFVESAKEIGITFIFFGNTRADIGLGCNYLIESNGGNKAQLIDTSDSRKTNEFAYNTISDADVKAMVQLLAPVYTEEISLEGTLTKNISLFELLNIIAVDDIDLSSRWSTSKVYQSMSAPIGVSKSGIITLDLHDKAHGPHGLVAGTTGAGKSEILQTYIMSMATLYHPYEVGFVIIDFKGGGMANQFKDLPHMMGTITNIDGKEINRSLKSIRAELKKRQRLFAEAEVNHIDKYILKFRNGEASIPLPHLILIVDEFAELKAEQPEFMKELISAARIGRSLGVHLILATQKPSGQVDEQIWSNSRFKLCLKVQSQQDSNEVLKSPLAAEIKEPGRAYLQVGNNEIFELFQSAYSGAPEHVDDTGTKEFTIFEISSSGRRIPVYQQKKKKGSENDRTQLDSLVQYVRDYCDTKGVSKLPSICLPPLSEMIDFPGEKFLHKNNNHIIADMGIYDDPDNQIQDMYTVDLSEQNMMIIGSAQSGKTNVLQTIIRSLSTKYSPEEVNIYIIDFASMYLKNFERLNHVGGVVTPSEDEKFKNLFRLLRMEVEVRKEKLLEVGVSSYSAYRESGRMDLPQIILIIDNLTALRELYFQDDDELLNLCREGIALGITVVIANSQTSGIGYRYLSNFANRMALFNNDVAEYNSLFDHCSERIPNVQGRAIIDIEKVHLDAQIFLAYNGEREIQKVKQIRQFIQECNEKYKGSVAKKIPEIPEILTEEYIQEQFKQSSHNVEIMAGMDFASVAPCWFDLRKLGTLAVSGRDKMGRHNFIRYMIHMVQQWYADSCEVYLIDSISRRLSDLRDFSVVRNYEVIAANAIEVVKSIEIELKKRYEAISVGNDDVLEHASLILLILNNKDIVEEISESSQAIEAYNNITGKYKNMGVCVIVGDFENAKVSYMSPEIFKQLRDARKFLYFDDLDNMKIIDDLPLATIRANKKKLHIGEAYYIRENNVMKIKTPKSEV